MVYLLGMSLNDLQFHEVEYNGDSVDAFDINPRYHGYTRDHYTFHVYDETAYAYASFDSADFDAKLRSGYFEDPQNVPSTEQHQNAPEDVWMDNQSGWVKPFFIGASLLMIIYIATRGK
jgi:hypothetical protein